MWRIKLKTIKLPYNRNDKQCIQLIVNCALKNEITINTSKIVNVTITHTVKQATTMLY